MPQLSLIKWKYDQLNSLIGTLMSLLFHIHSGKIYTNINMIMHSFFPKGLQNEKWDQMHRSSDAKQFGKDK